MNYKDQEIIENIRNGRDNDALAIIYKRSLPKIRKYVVSNNGTEDDVKDIFQDTIVIFYRQVKTGKFKEGADIDAFLYWIARNLYINYVKRYVSRNVKTQIIDSGDDTADLLGQLLGREREKRIERLFSELGESCSELLKLTIFNSLSMREIAEKMGFSNEDIAKTRAYRCRQKLADLVKKNPELTNFFKP